MEQTASRKPRRSVERRTLVKGAAWATPAIAVAGAAPAMAASGQPPPRGLNGWVGIGRNCWNTNWLQVDGRGSYPNRGLWVFTTADDKPQSARLTFFFDRNDLTFTNGSGTGWTNLVRDPARDSETPAAGFYAYTATYTGAWTYYDQWGTANDRWEATQDPHWYSRTSGCGQIEAYARRTVIYSDTDSITFTRGPITV